MNDRTQPLAALRWRPPGSQKGAVLFFTLIALVAMTLAALAMVRSVDTGNLVAGNIALKQGAIQEAERIMNTAFNCLDKGGPLTTMLEGNLTDAQPCHQYFATLQDDTRAPFGFPDILKGDLAALPLTIQRSEDMITRNTSVYVIERMCRTTGIWLEENCIAIPGTPAEYIDDDTTLPLPAPQAAYRISVRVYGPRNVNAYSQMIMSSGL